MKHYDDEILYEWVCPSCHDAQIDDYAWTTVLVCQQCEKEYEWTEVTMPNELQRLNRELEMLERE